MFLRGRYFVMGCTIDMNVDMFWETLESEKAKIKK